MGKKVNKLPFILFLPVSVGISLIVSGIATQRDDLLFAGITVLFGGSFTVGIIITFITIALSSSSKTPTEQNSATQNRTNDVLSEARRRADERTGGTSNETRAALDKIADSARKRKRKDAVAKFLAVLFIVSFIGCGIVGVALMTNELMVAGGIVFGCAPLMIVTMLVVVKIKEHVSMSDSKKSAENYDHKVGRVIRCTVSSTVSTPNRTTTTYKVEFEADGKDYTAYSRESYDRGDRLDIAVKRNGKSAKIVGRAEYSFIRERVKPLTAKTEKPQDDGKNEKVAETEQRHAAIMDSVEQLRAAKYIEDRVKQHEARTAARQAMLDELYKIKTRRAEEERKQKLSAEKSEDDEPKLEPIPEPDVSPAVSASASAPIEQEQPAAEERSARPASAQSKRAPVGYKGINRKNNRS